jgi:dehydrogenase/reductase SDR family member 12
MFKWLSSLLDHSILFSFDRTGYWRHIKEIPMPDYIHAEGKTAWLSGATGGIGAATARTLSEDGWELILPVRNLEKGNALLSSLSGVATFDPLNLSSLKEASSYTPYKPLDLVIHNAGGMPITKTITPEGYEEIFASQVFAPFILTLSWIKKGILKKGARVIFVSSGGMYSQKLSLDDLNFETRKYNKYTAYANAKRAQVILAELFAKKFPQYYFASMHPGWVKTPGVKYSMHWFYTLLYPLLRTPKEGADTLHYLANVVKWNKNGAFWFDRKPVFSHFSNKTKSSPEEKEALWNFCNDITTQWESLS